jgi:uncharacterized protein YjbJ (UPF0337 family)
MGDAKLEAEGKVDKAAGKAQSTIGDLKGVRFAANNPMQ